MTQEEKLTFLVLKGWKFSEGNHQISGGKFLFLENDKGYAYELSRLPRPVGRMAWMFTIDEAYDAETDKLEIQWWAK